MAGETEEATMRAGRPGTAFFEVYQARMKEIGELPVAEALRKSLAFRCPICGVIHPGMRYTRQRSREYCSKAHYARRQVRLGGPRMWLLQVLYGKNPVGFIVAQVAALPRLPLPPNCRYQIHARSYNLAYLLRLANRSQAKGN